MDENASMFDWRAALVQTYENLSVQIVEYIPEIIGAAALLFVGWATAWICRFFTRKLISGLDTLLQRVASRPLIEKSRFKSYTKLIANIVFWSVFLFFIAASASMLGWEIFSSGVTALLRHLPNVLAGLAIIFVGFAFSGIARTAVYNACASTGIAQSDLIARMAQFALVTLAIIIGVEQLGINMAFVTTALIVSGGVFLSGLALAFGLGAKDFMANVLGAQTTRKHLQVGQLIKIANIQGYLLEITSTTIILDTEQGRAAIPAKLFQESVSESIDEPNTDNLQGNNNEPQ